MTIDDLLDRVLGNAAATPDAVALVETGGWLRKIGRPPRVVRYGELADTIRRVESGLRARGLAEGDSIVFAVRPSIDAFVLLAAALRVGASVVAVDPGVGRELFAARLALVAPRWVFAESLIFAASSPGLGRRLAVRAGLELPELSSLDATFVRVGPRLPGVPRSVSLDELAASEPASDRASRPDPDRRALVIFTSGTTSAPKGVEHTAKSLGEGCAVIASLASLRPDDVVYSTQTHQMLMALVAGARCVIPGIKLDPDAFLRDVARHRVTHTYGVPFQFARIVERLESKGERLPAHVRAIIMGSAPITRGFLARMRDVIASETDVFCVYAMTEMLPVALVESREKLAAGDDGDLVGRPIDGARAFVAEDGELFVEGRNLFRGYLDHEPVKSHATGDLARLDSDGRIVLLGRKKDMIIRGHHNLYPSLYEDALSTIEGVARCALVGVPDRTGTDERLVLVVEPMPGVDPHALPTKVGRALDDGTVDIDRFARPDEILVRPIPHGGRSNKLDRNKLRSDLLAEITSR